MFLRFAYRTAGFSDDEWETMPRGDRVLVRDWYLNGRDTDQTLLYDEFETAYQVRKVERKYDLQRRPQVHFCLADFRFQ